MSEQTGEKVTHDIVCTGSRDDMWACQFTAAEACACGHGNPCGDQVGEKDERIDPLMGEKDERADSFTEEVLRDKLRRAEAKIRRIEALSDEWDVLAANYRKAEPVHFRGLAEDVERRARELRAALNLPPAQTSIPAPGAPTPLSTDPGVPLAPQDGERAGMEPSLPPAPEDVVSEIALTAGDLTDDHIGMVVLGVPGIAGWERILVLRDIEWRKDGLWLQFRWNDNPSNTHRGEYAIGRKVPTATPLRVVPSLPPE